MDNTLLDNHVIVQNENVLPNLGLTTEQREGVYQLLVTTLADEFKLRLKLRKYHWNITGHMFHSLHEVFEEQYTVLTSTIDEIAERVRAYGFHTPGTLDEFNTLARLQESGGAYPNAVTMLRDLVRDHEAMVRYLRDDLDAAGSTHNDAGAEDFLTGLLQQHQEMAWLLRAFIEKDVA